MPFDIMRGRRFGLVHAGMMARTVQDLQLFWNILKNTPIDGRFQKKISWPEPKAKVIHELRVAWIDEMPCGLDTLRVGRDVKSKLRSLTAVLDQQGVHLTKDSPQTCEEMLNVWGGMLFQITTQDESWLTRKLMGLLLKKMDNGSSFFNEIFASLSDTSLDRWQQLLRRQTKITTSVESFFNVYDILILPITYGPAFKKCDACPRLSDEDGESMHYIDYFPYTGMFNATGHPAVVVPMGLNHAGLPIGIQLVSGLYTDSELLQFIRMLEPFIAGFIRPK